MPRVAQQTITKAWIASIVLFIIIGSFTLIFLYIPFFNAVSQAENVINSSTASNAAKLKASSETILDFGALKGELLYM